jgi:hypothetical protein
MRIKDYRVRNASSGVTTISRYWMQPHQHECDDSCEVRQVHAAGSIILQVKQQTPNVRTCSARPDRLGNAYSKHCAM